MTKLQVLKYNPATLNHVNMRLNSGETLHSIVSNSSVIHIFGAGLNPEKPAHTAVKELSDRGWAIAPIHPRDAGATINGFPIRPKLDSGIVAEIVVLFLAPERAREVVRSLIINHSSDDFPLIWFQHGAEDEDSFCALDELGANYVANDCIVVNSNENDLKCENSILPQTWCLQVSSEDGDGCSVWSVHDTNSETEITISTPLEWVGSLDELNNSQHTIPRYIRSLRKESESLIDTAKRLQN